MKYSVVYLVYSLNILQFVSADLSQVSNRFRIHLNKKKDRGKEKKNKTFPNYNLVPLPPYTFFFLSFFSL